MFTQELNEKNDVFLQYSTLKHRERTVSSPQVISIPLNESLQQSQMILAKLTSCLNPCFNGYLQFCNNFAKESN